jgi:hypothetical protein
MCQVIAGDHRCGGVQIRRRLTDHGCLEHPTVLGGLSQTVVRDNEGGVHRLNAAERAQALRVLLLAPADGEACIIGVPTMRRIIARPLVEMQLPWARPFEK